MSASPRGAATAILAVPPPRIDASVHLEGGYLRRFCRQGNFVRQCSRVILAESSLKTELPGVLKGVNFGAHARQDPLEMLESWTVKLAVSVYANWSIRVGIRTGRLCELTIRKWEPVSTKFRRFKGLPALIGVLIADTRRRRDRRRRALDA
jgi:hypothetical protein